MKKYIKKYIIACCCLWVATPMVHADTVLTVAFDSMTSTGAVDTNDLNSVSTGGTWDLVTNRGASYTIEVDGDGDKALLLDDSATSGNAGVIRFCTVSLTSAIDLDSVSASWVFRTGARRTGTNRGLRFEFLAGANVAATLDWASDDTLSLNGSQGGSALYKIVNPWNHTSTNVHDVSVSFNAGTVVVDFGGQTLSSTVQNGVTSIDSMQIYSIGSSSSTRGLFLDDLSVTTGQITVPVINYEDFHYRGLEPGHVDYDSDFIRVYSPSNGVAGVTNRPAILMFHGGAWVKGDAVQFYTFCQNLADMGFVTASANYRFSSHSAASSYNDKKELCVADARLATAWLEARSADFGFADGQIILGGGSAGGHIATMIALQPDELAAVVSGPLDIPALLLFNPAYDEDETSGSASLLVDPERQLAEMVANSQLPPPAIHFFGNYDLWRTPLAFLNESGGTDQGFGRALPFIDACRAAGAEAELWYAIGQAHSFFNADNWLERCIVAVDDFLNGHGIIPAVPAAESFAHPELQFELGTDLHAWRLQWFGNEAATGDAADDANPDGDAADNFTEFALGTNPLASNTVASLRIESAGTPVLRFSRRNHSYAYADPVAVVELQTCTNLLDVSWQPVAIHTNYIEGITNAVESLSVPVDFDAASDAFFKLDIRPFP